MARGGPPPQPRPLGVSPHRDPGQGPAGEGIQRSRPSHADPDGFPESWNPRLPLPEATHGPWASPGLPAPPAGRFPRAAGGWLAQPAGNVGSSAPPEADGSRAGSQPRAGLQPPARCAAGKPVPRPVPGCRRRGWPSQPTRAAVGAGTARRSIPPSSPVPVPPHLPRRPRRRPGRAAPPDPQPSPPRAPRVAAPQASAATGGRP